MAAVSISTIRQRIATAIDAIAGFSEARNPFPNFGRSPNSVAHKRFSIGILSIISEDNDRQRQAIGVFCRTMLGIKFAYRIRPKDQIVSLDESTDIAQTVIQTITNRTSTVYTNLQIRFEQMQQQLTDTGEFNIIELQFSVYHQLPLQ